jgi:hypothetical protein
MGDHKEILPSIDYTDQSTICQEEWRSDRRTMLSSELAAVLFRPQSTVHCPPQSLSSALFAASVDRLVANSLAKRLDLHYLAGQQI